MMVTIDRLRRWMRRHGLAPFGFHQEGFHHGHQLIRVWGPLMPARWEVYHWTPNTGSGDVDDWLSPLPPGSAERYHRIGFSAERVYCGKSWGEAKRAMRGDYGRNAYGWAGDGEASVADPADYTRRGSERWGLVGREAVGR